MHSDPDQYEQVIDRLKSLCERTVDKSDRQILLETAAALSGLQRENREIGERADRAEAILSATGRWVIAYDADGRVMKAGPAMDEKAGASLIGMEMQAVATALAMRHPDGRPMRQDEMPAYRALRGETVAGERLDITDREGKTTRAVVSAAPVTIGGVPFGAVVVWQDVTEQERIQRSLDEANTLLEGMFESLGDIVGVQFPDQTILRYNRAGYEALGMTPEEVIGRKCYELIGRDRPCEVCATRAAVRSKRQERLEKYVPEMGRYLECWSTPVLDENGDVLLIVEHLHDITDRVLAMDALRESEATARALINAPTDAISLVGADGRVIDVNETMIKRYGKGREAIIGRHIGEIFPADTARERVARLATVLELGVPVRFEEPGITGWYDTVIYPIRDETGRIVRAAMIARDITDRKQFERVRQEAFSQIEQNMEQFAILGDHVRHPLQVILARAELMEDEETAEKVREQVRRINDYITSLDRGWIESRKIREFLRRNEMV